jgi:hypothetical protein
MKNLESNYLIVDPEKESIEIYFLEDSKYTLQDLGVNDTFTFSLENDCEINLTLQNIWA